MTGLLVLSACVLLIISLKALAAKGVLSAWFRGSFFIILCVFSVILLLLAYDYSGYQKQVSAEKIATVSITSIGQQHYLLSLSVNKEQSIDFELYGDMWQLDARLMVWQSLWSYLGLNAVYRLDRLSGRYHDVEDEYSKDRSIFNLNQYVSYYRLGMIDLWQILTDYPWLPGVEAKFGSGAYMPMSDGANYSIYIVNGSVQARADNAPALRSVEQWFQ
jgi:hypothetical protein